MKINLSYYVSFGAGDCSDSLDAEVELTREESIEYIQTLIRDEYQDEWFENSDASDRAYKEISGEESENLCDMGDPYACECEGTDPMDTDELNELVHSHDKYALEFFDLEDADDETIDSWDANELEEIPTVEEFDPDFEEESPFDSGYNLIIHICEVDMDDETMEWLFKEAIEIGDDDLISEFIEYLKENYDGDDETIQSLLWKNLNITVSYGVKYGRDCSAEYDDISFSIDLYNKIKGIYCSTGEEDLAVILDDKNLNEDQKEELQEILDDIRAEIIDCDKSDNDEYNGNDNYYDNLLISYIIEIPEDWE